MRITHTITEPNINPKRLRKWMSRRERKRDS